MTFVSVSIFGGAIIQYPLGYLSDIWDRRTILLVSTAGALLAALGIVFLAGSSPLANFVLVFIFGSFAMPLFSLSAAHANDRAGKGEFVLVNAALMLFYSFGAVGRAAGRLLFHAGLRPALAVPVQRRRLRRVHRDHALPDGRQGRRSVRPPGALHRAAQDLDDVCQTGPPQRRRRDSAKH